jgi:uridine kinase
MALLDPTLRSLYDLKVIFILIHYRQLLTIVQIFVQCDSDLMLSRRIRRDTRERGRTVDGILDQYVIKQHNIAVPTAYFC